MKLLTVTALLAAAITHVSADLTVDFEHYSQEGCWTNGGTRIGKTNHLEANNDPKNFNSDGQPVFKSITAKVTEDAKYMNKHYCELIICTEYDCKGGNRTSLGDLKDYADGRCRDTHTPGRAVDFVCRDRDNGAGTSTISMAAQTTIHATPKKHDGNNLIDDGDCDEDCKMTKVIDKDLDHHWTSTHFEGHPQASTTITRIVNHQMRTVTLTPQPSKPDICNMCDYWWWGGAEQYKQYRGRHNYHHHDDDDDEL